MAGGVIQAGDIIVGLRNSTNYQFIATPISATAPLTYTAGVIGLTTPLAVGYGGTGLSSTSANQILFSSANNVIAGLTSSANGILITSAGSIPSISSTLPAAVQANITATGALTAGSLATGFTPITVPLGGTGDSAFTAFSVITAGISAGAPFQNVSGLGTAFYVLTSNGPGAFPTWQAAGAGGGFVTSIIQTANQISASSTTGAVTLTIPAVFVAPGSISATTTVSGTTFNSSTLTASTALVSDTSKNIVSSITTATELSYVHGVTSAIQTQINAITASVVTSITGDGSTILVTPTTGNAIVSILPTYVGQASITTLGTIATGVWHGSVISSTYGGTGINNSGSTITVGGNTALIGAFTFAGTLTGNTTVTFPTSGTLATTATANVISVTGDGTTITASPTTGAVGVSIYSGYVGQTSITTLGTITTGVWNGTLVAPTYGGTGLNSSTATAHGILVSEGASAFNPIVLTAGQVLIGTTAGDPVGALIGGATNQITVTSATGAITISIPNNPILPGTGGVTLPQGTTAQEAGAAGTIRFNTQTTVFEGTLDGSTWTPFTTAAGTVVSVSGATNRITSTGGVTPVIDISPAYVGQTSITTLGTITTGVWNGSLIPLAFGGTNANLTASNGGIFYSTATAGAILSGTATAGQMLQSGSSTAPTWSTSVWPATTTVNQILYSSSNNVVAGITTGNNGTLITGTTGIPSILGNGTTGQVFTATTGSPPSWATPAASGTVTSSTQNNLAYYAANGTVVSGLATANNSGLLTNGSGVPAWVTVTGTGAPVLATSPTLITPTLGVATATSLKFSGNNGLIDSNGNEILALSPVASSVNNIIIGNGGTGASPFISAQGSDTNVTLALAGQGNGGVNIKGTAAAGNAPAGYVGEFVTSNVPAASAVNMPSSTSTNITTISLTAGDWDVWGNIQFTSGGGQFLTSEYGWINLTSVTVPDPSSYNSIAAATTAVSSISFNVPIIRVNVSTTTTVYLTGLVVFGTSTANACGNLSARRIR